jgi:spore cortex formation protein SpoVR/YcgB (stage V sporulation)
MNGILLDQADADRVLHHLAYLWGYEVCLNEVSGEGGSVLKEHKAKPESAKAKLP